MNWTKIFRKEKKYITHKTCYFYEPSYLILRKGKYKKDIQDKINELIKEINKLKK